MIATTKQYLDDGVENIYEATFNFFGILVMVDILTISNGEVSIYEVKSSTEVKDIIRILEIKQLQACEVASKIYNVPRKNNQINKSFYS